MIRIKKYRMSKRSLRRLICVEPILLAIILEGIKNSPYDFGIPNSGGFRTSKEQNELYKQIPRVSYIDGYNKKSYHQTGRAFDIYIFYKGNASWDKNKLKKVAIHLKKVAINKFNIKLEWGGDWTTFKDYPHFQIQKNQT